MSNVTTNSVRLSWPNVTGAIRYTYNYGSCDVNVRTATSVNVDGLTTSTNYNFLVTVYGQSGTGNTIACGGSTGKVNFQVFSVHNFYSRQNAIKHNQCGVASNRRFSINISLCISETVQFKDIVTIEG